MLSDPWLTRWLPLLIERSADAPVLEIGCGHGDDTVTVTQAGLDVVAFDISPMCVAAAKLRAPTARIECRDTRDPLPTSATPFGAVIASLSLHYFPWAQTTSIVHRIRECLSPGGVLLCRLNSTEDHHFGAGRGTLIEENFYAFEGQKKRFFDKASIERLFAEGWRPLAMAQKTTRKYMREKAMWEVVVERAA